MNIALMLIAVGVLVPTAVLSALSRALVQVSQSQLERELQQRRQLERGRWLLDRLDRVEWTVSLLRTIGRMTFFSVVLLMAVGLDGALTLTGLVIAGVTSVLLLWLITSVVAGGFARYAPAEAIAGCLPLLRATYATLYPIVWLADAAEGAVRRVVGADSPRDRQEEELLSSIEDTHRQGAIDEVSAAILENVVQFGGTSVGAVMTPRSSVKALGYTDDLAAIRGFLERAGHSRIPIHEGGLDRVVGILYVKDLIPYLGHEPQGFVLRRLLRPAVSVPETKAVRDQLLDFQRSKVHLAIVVDEYGGTSGVVTIEDVLEELVGEIRDEHENEGADLAPMRQVSPGVVEVQGKLPIHELNEAVGTTIPEDDGFETVAGFLLARLGRIPEPGTVLQAEGAEFKVIRATATTVDAVRVTRYPVHDEPGD